MKVELDFATRDDFASLGLSPPCRVRALAGRGETGDVLGIGGIAFPDGGQAFAWADLQDAARMHPVSLHRAGLRILRMARDMGLRRLIATADMVASPAAERWLERLGFVKETEHGIELWVWTNDDVH